MVDIVRFQTGVHLGGAHGRPLVAQLAVGCANTRAAAMAMRPQRKFIVDEGKQLPVREGKAIASAHLKSQLKSTREIS